VGPFARGIVDGDRLRAADDSKNAADCYYRRAIGGAGRIACAVRSDIQRRRCIVTLAVRGTYFSAHAK